MCLVQFMKAVGATVLRVPWPGPYMPMSDGRQERTFITRPGCLIINSNGTNMISGTKRIFSKTFEYPDTVTALYNGTGTKMIGGTRLILSIQKQSELSDQVGRAECKRPHEKDTTAQTKTTKQIPLPRL